MAVFFSVVYFQAEVIVVSLFVTSEHGFLVQDNFPLDPGCNRLLALEIPFYYFVKKVPVPDFFISN
jgi:intraflagellar transport protein 140